MNRAPVHSPTNPSSQYATAALEFEFDPPPLHADGTERVSEEAPPPTRAGAELPDTINVDGQVRHATNPHRGVVLMWYRKMMKSAFTVPWEEDRDAEYVIQETQFKFRRNMGIRDLKTIERKIEEAEQRYGLAVHYRIPYPRPLTFGGQAPMGDGGSAIPYASYLDSHYDDTPKNTRCATPQPGSVGSFDSSGRKYGVGAQGAKGEVAKVPNAWENPNDAPSSRVLKERDSEGRVNSRGPQSFQPHPLDNAYGVNKGTPNA